jgi:hypothetical protein
MIYIILDMKILKLLFLSCNDFLLIENIPINKIYVIKVLLLP